MIIGGGATGVGIAVDAASRGYQVLLLEQRDFGKGTSSRSTKLVHGGVRYLEQGNISLVMEALKERGMLRPTRRTWSATLPSSSPTTSGGKRRSTDRLKIYDLLAGKYGFGTIAILSRDETLRRLPTLKTEGLRGGVLYYDGQFDDARLLINLVRTAAEQGAMLLNYARVTGLTKDAGGFVDGLVAHDLESGDTFQVRAPRRDQRHRSVLRRGAAPRRPDAPALIAPSQGIHLVFDRSFLPGEARSWCRTRATAA